MQHLYCPHVTFKTPNYNPHLWNPFGNPPTLHPTFNKGENTHTHSKTHTHAHTSLSSCVIIKLFWTSHWKSNATCVSTRQMYCSCLSAPISSVIQPSFSPVSKPPPTPATSPPPPIMHWQHPLLWSLITKSEYLHKSTGQTECIFVVKF